MWRQINVHTVSYFVLVLGISAPHAAATAAAAAFPVSQEVLPCSSCAPGPTAGSLSSTDIITGVLLCATHCFVFKSVTGINNTVNVY